MELEAPVSRVYVDGEAYGVWVGLEAISWFDLAPRDTIHKFKSKIYMTDGPV